MKITHRKMVGDAIEKLGQHSVPVDDLF